MRYCIILNYDGTRYHGWQRQPDGITVQEALETALETFLRSKVNVVGAGRTDKGVHARMMAAHFDWPDPLDTDRLTFRLNCLLPPDIAVSQVKPVSDDWHARFSAVARTYHYYITTQKNAFLPLYSLRLFCPLDIGLMNQAGALMLAHEDFGCFCKSHSSNKTNICHLSEARWIIREDGLYRFRITANRFLRNMVRAVVGTMIEVGRGRLPVDDFQKILDSGDRRMAGESVPACGLFLQEVRYDNW